MAATHEVNQYTDGTRGGGYGRALRMGVVTAIALAVLSVAEFVVAKQIDDPTWWMVPFMVLKGGLILDVFMHVRDLRGEGAH